MSRRLTLRGEVDFNGVGTIEELLFSYEANDLTKGWKVTDSSIWVKNVKGLAAGRSSFNIQQQLQTDTANSNENLTADDNRAFGWLRSRYETSGGTATFTGASMHDMVVLDPDHMITKEFYHTLTFNGDNGFESDQITICYLITMEEQKLSPSETILQMVKGVAQDIEN